MPNSLLIIQGVLFALVVMMSAFEIVKLRALRNAQRDAERQTAAAFRLVAMLEALVCEDENFNMEWWK
jgi:hypothetical protein